MFALLKKTISQVLWFVGSLLFLLMLTFFASSFNPVDPVLNLVGENASQAVHEKERKQLGLDKPIPVRFVHYLKQCLQGDFGVSVSTGTAVLDDLKRVFPVTLDIATLALLITILIGVPLGAICAFFGSSLDRWVSAFTIVGHSAPNFLVGYAVLILSFSFTTCSGFVAEKTTVFRALWSGDYTACLNMLQILWPPVVTLAYLSLSYVVRMMRGFTLDEKGENYFLTAKIKGLSNRYVFFKHMMPNILPRLISVLAFIYTFLLEGSIVTEMVFAIPGQGSYLVRAVMFHDDPAIMGATIFIGIAIFSVNIFADFLSMLLQPSFDVKVRGRR